MSPEQLVISTGIIFGAYFIRGITGFGSGLIAVPLLAHFLPLQFVVPFILIMDFTASLVLGRSGRQHIQWKELTPLLPFSAVGVMVGVTLLVRMPREPLLIGLGLFVLAFGLRTALNIHGEKPVSRWWAIPAGLMGGTVGALFGTGGPPYIVYLAHRLRDKGQLRATFSGLFIFDGGVRLLTFLAIGLLFQSGMPVALMAAFPVMALGLWLGHRAHLGFSNSQMLKLIGMLLIGSGASLIWKAMA